MDIIESLTLIADLDICRGISLNSWPVVSSMDDLVDK